MEGLIFGGRAYIPNVLSVSEYSGLIRGGGYIRRFAVVNNLLSFPKHDSLKY